MTDAFVKSNIIDRYNLISYDSPYTAAFGLGRYEYEYGYFIFKSNDIWQVALDLNVIFVGDKPKGIIYQGATELSTLDQITTLLDKLEKQLQEPKLREIKHRLQFLEQDFI